MGCSLVLGQPQASHAKVVAPPCPDLYITIMMLSNGIWSLLGLCVPQARCEQVRVGRAACPTLA